MKSLYRVITWKLLFDGRRNDTFDSGRCKSIKWDFSAGRNEEIFDCWVGVSPILRISHKGSWEGGTVHTWWVQKKKKTNIKGRDIFGKEGIILGDIPAEHCFVLRDLVLSSFFK